MTARFILSLDCEGKWGVADCLAPNHDALLSDANLKNAYEGILRVLSEFNMPATFAFVGAFAERRENLDRHRSRLEYFHSLCPGYIGPIFDQWANGQHGGWHGHWAVDLVGASNPGHEIALHGVTHIPWTRLSGQAARAEFEFLSEMETPVKNAKTFIFPRNDVAHTDVLSDHGLMGYRCATPARSRLQALLSEGNLLSQPDDDPDLACEVPAGFFVNWQSGPRKVIPIWLSEARASLLLDRAARTQSVVHYWLHPENIATAPDTLMVLRRILKRVALARDAGQCEVLTQVDYLRGKQFGTMRQ